jgi:hypothetical protein
VPVFFLFPKQEKNDSDCKKATNIHSHGKVAAFTIWTNFHQNLLKKIQIVASPSRSNEEKTPIQIMQIFDPS